MDVDNAVGDGWHEVDDNDDGFLVDEDEDVGEDEDEDGHDDDDDNDIKDDCDDDNENDGKMVEVERLQW